MDNPVRPLVGDGINGILTFSRYLVPAGCGVTLGCWGIARSHPAWNSRVLALEVDVEFRINFNM